jgi:hypothetical protein
LKCPKCGAAGAALDLVGDGVAVPVVRWLAENIIEPILSLPTKGGAKDEATAASARSVARTSA